MSSAQVQANGESNQSESRKPVDFSDIGLNKVEYSDKFLVRLGTASQIVKAFVEIHNNAVNGTKPATNEYQKILYPTIAKFAKEIGDKYEEIFLSGEMSPLRRQVFGANLNGSQNNGSVGRSVNMQNVRPNLRYEYAQFKKLLLVLCQRLEYIATRDPMLVDRYLKNVDERNEFLELQTRAKFYLDYLAQEDDPNSLISRWEQSLPELRKQAGIELESEKPKSKPKFVPQKRFQKNNSEDSNNSQTEQRPQKRFNKFNNTTTKYQRPQKNFTDGNKFVAKNQTQSESENQTENTTSKFQKNWNSVPRKNYTNQQSPNSNSASGANRVPIGRRVQQK